MFKHDYICLFVLFAVPATANDADEFEKWQREVRQAEAEAEQEVNDDQDRPSTPPEGEEEFTDDDGTVYKWDRILRAWAPQVVSNLFVLFVQGYPSFLA
jgi:hypothetical protein